MQLLKLFGLGAALAILLLAVGNSEQVGLAQSAFDSAYNRVVDHFGPPVATAKFTAERKEGTTLSCKAVLFGTRQQGVWFDVCEEDMDDDEEVDFCSCGTYKDGKAHGVYWGDGIHGPTRGSTVGATYGEPPPSGSTTTQVKSDWKGPGDPNENSGEVNTERDKDEGITWSEDLNKEKVRAFLGLSDEQWPACLGSKRAALRKEALKILLKKKISDLLEDPAALHGGATTLPRVADVTATAFEPGSLVWAVEVVGAIPAQPETSLRYQIFFDTDRDSSTGNRPGLTKAVGAEYTIWVGYDPPFAPGEWAAAFFEANEEGGYSQRAVPLDWTVEGNLVSVTIPLEQLGNPAVFNWVVQTVAAGAADLVPNEGFGFWFSSEDL